MHHVPEAPDAEPTEGGDDSDNALAGLSPTQRWLAGAVGLPAAGAGSVAVFASSNQAGTTALLVLGLAFLLIGIQGTPLRKAGKDSFELGPLVAKRVAKTLATGGPQAAAEALENYRNVAPSIDGSPAVARVALNVADAAAYEDQVRRALFRAIPDMWSVGWAEHDIGADAVVKDPSGQPILLVEVKYSRASRPISEGSLNQTMLHRWLLSQRSPNAHAASLLVLTNSPVPGDATADNIYFCQWRDEQDDAALAELITRLRSS